MRNRWAFQDPRRLAVESVLCQCCVKFFGIRDIPHLKLQCWSLGFEILKQNRGDIPDWKYAREVGCQKVTVAITGLLEVLGQDYGIEEPCWEPFGNPLCCRNCIKLLYIWNQKSELSVRERYGQCSGYRPYLADRFDCFTKVGITLVPPSSAGSGLNQPVSETWQYQWAKKVRSFTACHSGKLWLACTTS